MHQTRSVQEGVHLVNQLLDIKRNLDGFADVASISASAGRFRDASSLFKPIPHFRNVGLQRLFEGLSVHGGGSFRHHTRSVLQRSPVENQKFLKARTPSSTRLPDGGLRATRSKPTRSTASRSRAPRSPNATDRSSPMAARRSPSARPSCLLPAARCLPRVSAFNNLSRGFENVSFGFTYVRSPVSGLVLPP